MSVQLNESLCVVDHFRCGVDHSLPDPGKISQVEDVMELGWCRQHLLFGSLPDDSSQGNQSANQVVSFFGEPCNTSSG